MEIKNVNELNQKAWNKILTKQIGQLKKSLEIEIEYCDYILYDIPSDMFRNKMDYADIIQNLEYILNDFYKSSSNGMHGYSLETLHETLNCNFRTLETILKKIKGHE